MLPKKYMRIILGALCAFLLLSLLSSFVGIGNKEGFEGSEQDMTPEAFDKVLKNIASRTNFKTMAIGETPADAAAFDKLLKKKLVHFLGTLPVPYNAGVESASTAGEVPASNADILG